MAEIPQVYARLVPSRGYQRSNGLVVDQCPFCGQVHRHTFSQQDGNSFGLRQADCLRGEYELIDYPPSPTLPNTQE